MSESDAALQPVEGTLDGDVFFRHWRPEQPRAVVLLIHGLGEHSGRYQHVAEALAASGIASYAPDHIGHGRSPGQRCHIGDFGQFATPLDELLAMAKSQYPGLPCFIVGHSMGGLITGNYLLTHQHSFRGAVFSGALFEVPEPPGSIAMFLYKLLAMVLPKMGALQLDASQISRDPEVVRRYNEDPLVHDGKNSVSLVLELLSAVDTLKKGRENITLPVLVMHGQGDAMTPPAGSQNFHDGVGSTDKALHLYPALYHEIFNEPEKDQVLADLVDWIDKRVGDR